MSLKIQDNEQLVEQRSISEHHNPHKALIIGNVQICCSFNVIIGQYTMYDSNRNFTYGTKVISFMELEAKLPF